MLHHFACSPLFRQQQFAIRTRDLPLADPIGNQKDDPKDTMTLKTIQKRSSDVALATMT